MADPTRNDLEWSKFTAVGWEVAVNMNIIEDSEWTIDEYSRNDLEEKKFNDSGQVNWIMTL